MRLLILLVITTMCAAMQQPVSIEADDWKYDHKANITIFNNVSVRQDKLTLKALRAIAHSNTREKTIITLTGSPVTFIQQAASDTESIKGQCNSLEYNTQTGIMILSGRARISKGRNVIIGDKLMYNTATEVYSTYRKGSRVTIILDPST